MSLLTINNFSLQFTGSAEPVVKNISLALEKGDMTALVGESGSGKSVTALSVMQLHNKGSVTYPEGSIRLGEEELLGAPEEVLQQIRGKRISMVFQEPMTSLNPLHTIGRQVAEIIRQHNKMSEKDIHNRVLELFDKVGLSAFHNRLNAYPHQLSGGERQRVMIAMAIANDPDLLIADEPTTALDVNLETQIIDLLKTLQKDMNMSILLITHDLTLVRRVADHVAIMKDGEIVEYGDTVGIFKKPKHDYTKHLLSSTPSGSAVPLPPDPELVLSCENLKVHFPAKKNFFGKPIAFKKAVDNITLDVRRGETLGIVGESGSGKTTLGLALLRLVPSKGRIVFMGQKISRMNTRALRHLRKDVQFIFQDPFSSLNPRMTIGAIIGEGLRTHHPEMFVAGKGRSAVTQIMEEVGLSPDMINRYPHEFSGGQRQRISIARAMILRPDVVVLDEPTSALDVSLQVQIIDLLKTLQEKQQNSYLFISHDLKVIRAISHNIIVLKEGEIVERGATEDIFEKPEHPYTKMLMDAALIGQTD